MNLNPLWTSIDNKSMDVLFINVAVGIQRLTLIPANTVHYIVPNSNYCICYCSYYRSSMLPVRLRSNG